MYQVQNNQKSGFILQKKASQAQSQLVRVISQYYNKSPIQQTCHLSEQISTKEVLCFKYLFDSVSLFNYQQNTKYAKKIVCNQYHLTTMYIKQFGFCKNLHSFILVLFSLEYFWLSTILSPGIHVVKLLNLHHMIGIVKDQVKVHSRVKYKCKESQLYGSDFLGWDLYMQVCDVILHASRN